MPANFIDDTQVLADLADMLAQAGGNALEERWVGLASKGNLWAMGVIYGALAARGYTPPQIVAWDRGVEFARDLATYRALMMGGALQNVAAELIESLDRREELLTVSITIGGEFVVPGSTVGQPNTGPVDTEGDFFGKYKDDQDSRIGQVPRF